MILAIFRRQKNVFGIFGISRRHRFLFFMDCFVEVFFCALFLAQDKVKNYLSHFVYQYICDTSNDT